MELTQLFAQAAQETNVVFWVQALREFGGLGILAFLVWKLQPMLLMFLEHQSKNAELDRMARHNASNAFQLAIAEAYSTMRTEGKENREAHKRDMDRLTDAVSKAVQTACRFQQEVAAVALLLCCSALGAQWLPAAVQERERALWETTGVEFPEGARFYELPKVSQRLSRFENDVFGIYSARFDGYGPFAGTNVNRQYPWTTPAGLALSPAEQWRVSRVAHFPTPVRVYRNVQGVFNGSKDQPQTFIDWSFPDGTVFAEMLIRKHAGMEWPFEIRMRTKQAGKWDDGATYRPFTEPPAETTAEAWQLSPGKLSDFGVGWLDVTVHRLPRRSLFVPRWGAFKLSRVALTAQDDDSAVPRNYAGNVTRCMTCHDKAGESTSYGATTIRGNDSILSWHPFTLDTLGSDAPPVLDGRWPLVNQAGLRIR